jgi:hypothetical protein
MDGPLSVFLSRFEGDDMHMGRLVCGVRCASCRSDKDLSPDQQFHAEAEAELKI